MLKIVFYAILLIATSYTSYAQNTIYGVVSDSPGQILEGVVVRTMYFSDSTVTNEMGEFQLVVPDSCKTLIFSFGELTHVEEINEKKIINVMFNTGGKSKTMLSLNPRKDYPLGVQLTLAGHSLFALSVNYFISQNYSLELGVCGRGWDIGARRYFSLIDYGRNKALYLGAITSFSLEGDFNIYIPFGYHILTHNGMAFGIEIAGKTPLYTHEYLGAINYLGFGINFGFQF